MSGLILTQIHQNNHKSTTSIENRLKLSPIEPICYFYDRLLQPVMEIYLTLNAGVIFYMNLGA